MERAARPVERIVHEVERALAAEIGLVAELDLDLVGKRAHLLHPLAREGEVVGLAHVEVQIDRIDRYDRRKQGRRAGPSPAAGDQVADGYEMGTDSSGEWRRDPAMLDIEPCVEDLRLRIVDGSLRGLLVGRALVDILCRSETGAPERLSAIELAPGEVESSGRVLQLSRC